MATYTPYDKQGAKLWRVTAYLGLDSVTGKQRNMKKGGFKTKKEAQLYYNQVKLDFENGTLDQENKSLTYGQVYQEWLEVYRKTVKESTCFKTEYLFKQHILPVLGELKVQKITSAYLQKQLNRWYERFGQYKKVFNYACTVLQYAVVQGYIRDNPKQRVTMPKIPLDYGHESESLAFYTREQLQALLGVLDGQWLAFFRLLAFSGMRRGEALALTWNDISFKDNTVSISKTLTQGHGRRLIVLPPKTKTSNRIITLDPKTMAILKSWKIEQAKLLLTMGHNATRQGQLIFCKVSSNSFLDLAAPRNRLYDACKKNDLPFIKVHGFRHTHCSLLFDAGVPLKDVKERLGHSDIQTTMNIYTHVTQDSRDKSAQLFAKYVNF